VFSLDGWLSQLVPWCPTVCVLSFSMTFAEKVVGFVPLRTFFSFLSDQLMRNEAPQEHGVARGLFWNKRPEFPDHLPAPYTFRFLVTPASKLAFYRVGRILFRGRDCPCPENPQSS